MIDFGLVFCVLQNGTSYRPVGTRSFNSSNQLIAQAQLEGLVLLTTDRQLEPYDVTLRWAS